MANHDRTWLLELCDRWDRQATELEKMAENGAEYTAAEKKLLRMHARVKRGDANELRIEARKIRHG